MSVAQPIVAPGAHDVIGSHAADAAMTAAALRTQELQDRLAAERWANEGGRVALSRAAQATYVAPAHRRRCLRPRVLIAGGGVAGLEALLALSVLASDLVDVTLLAPELTFFDRAGAASQPFEPPRVRGMRLADIAHDLDAHLRQGHLDRVEHDRRRVITSTGDELAYDMLVLAVGARPARLWQSDGVLTISGDHDGGMNSYPVLLHQIRQGQISRVAFVKPDGATWPTPLYDLALLTAGFCAAHDRGDVELTLITPEPRPLAIFGAAASAAMARLLHESGVALRTSSHGLPRGRGWLDLTPGDAGMSVDRIVTQPRLVGPRLRGIPCDRDGFIPTDSHGRVIGIDDTFAAGDATAVAVKHGGVAAQQADAVAAMIAFTAGVTIQPRPFRLTLGGTQTADDPQGPTTSETPSWSSPDSLGGGYLAPDLGRPSSNVTAQDQHALDILLAHVAPGSWQICLDLLDLPAREDPSHLDAAGRDRGNGPADPGALSTKEQAHAGQHAAEHRRAD